MKNQDACTRIAD